eukprot:scaffold884_cov398-Prasinococcus_capsulatus_cf.AAC.29
MPHGGSVTSAIFLPDDAAVIECIADCSSNLWFLDMLPVRSHCYIPTCTGTKYTELGCDMCVHLKVRGPWWPDFVPWAGVSRRTSSPDMAHFLLWQRRISIRLVHPAGIAQGRQGPAMILTRASTTSSFQSMPSYSACALYRLNALWSARLAGLRCTHAGRSRVAQVVARAY